VPLSRSLARFNRRVTNPVIGRIAGWMPGFAILIHVGARTGRSYRTPVNVFRRRGEYVFALTYGSSALWVRNVLVAGECDIETRRRRVHLTNPRLRVDPSLADLPAPARFLLRRNDVTEFLDMTPAPDM
jgi:deazaflavin-dependent oxidoreductase (nitroreductase family)